MATTVKQDEQFIKEVLEIPSDLLERAITWIQENLSPEEVFDQKTLEEWAHKNGFIYLP